MKPKLQDFGSPTTTIKMSNKWPAIFFNSFQPGFCFYIHIA